MLVVRARFARVAQLAQVVHRVAADVADRDPPLLGDVAGDLHHLLAALLGHSGILRRISCPSLFGVRPRSDSLIARSIALIEHWSYGWMVSSRASGAWIVASCLSGVGAP